MQFQGRIIKPIKIPVVSQKERYARKKEKKNREEILFDVEY